MIDRSKDYREKVSQGLKMQNAKITFQDELLVVKNIKYSFGSDIFKSVMRTISFECDNTEIHNKDINFEYGLFINNNYEYLNLGHFFVKDLSDNKKKEIITMTAYDKMINFMIDFNFSKLNIKLPCTMLEFVRTLAEYCGLELFTEKFFNNDLVITEDFFSVKKLSCRDVLDKVAEATLSNIFIKNDKLYVRTLDSTIVDTLTKKDIENLTINEKFGPLNSLILGRGDVGDDEVECDEESIEKYGLQEFRIDENEFLDSDRFYLKKTMFNKIKGIEFYSFESKDLGFIYFEPGDFIIQSDRNDKKYITLILNLSTNITTGITQTTKMEIPEFTTNAYVYTDKEEKRNLKVERLAKKNEGIIQDLIQDTTEFSEKLVKYQATLEGIEEIVSSIEDLTRASTGVNQVFLESTVDGDGYILQMKIEGDMECLTPSEDLFPSDDLYPLNNNLILVVDKEPKNKRTSEAVTYEIPIKEPVRKLSSTVYDYIIYEEGIFYCIRRVGVNENDEYYELDKEIKEELITINIKTFQDNSYIYAEEYSNLNYSCTYIIDSELAKLYATKTELKSAIKILNNSILEEVSLDYTTKEETKEMDKKNDENTKQLKASLELKVDINKLISEINASADIIRIIGQRLIIEMQNFKLDENGNVTSNNMTANDMKATNMTAINSTVSGNVTAKSGNIGGFDVKENYLANGTTKLGQNDNSVYLGNDGISCGKNFKVNKNGQVTCSDMLIDGGKIEIYDDRYPFYDEYFIIHSKDGDIKLDSGRLMFDNKNNVSFSTYIGHGEITVGNDQSGMTSITPNQIYIGNYQSGINISKNGINIDGKSAVFSRNEHNCKVEWNESQLLFYVDETMVGTLSDKRLKTDIKDIDEDFIKAIKEIEMKQFKVFNRGGLISFGILAQDLIEIFKKYGKNPFDYEIVYKTKYKANDDTIYYGINYEQFLLLKTKAQELEIKQLKEKQKNILERIEKLEEVAM